MRYYWEYFGFFLVFFPYHQNGYVWCQLPENWQKSSKQAIQIMMFLIEWNWECASSKMLIHEFRTLRQANLGSLVTKTHMLPSPLCCLWLLPLAPGALEPCICSASFYPDPSVSQFWGFGVEVSSFLAQRIWWWWWWRVGGVVNFSSLISFSNFNLKNKNEGNMFPSTFFPLGTAIHFIFSLSVSTEC